VDAYTKLRL
jgi:hypothetical protein